jgi:hypothetical protein
MGSGDIAPPILNLGSMVSFTHRPLYLLGKSPQYPLARKLDGFSVSLDAVEKRKISAPAENQIPILPSLNH